MKLYGILFGIILLAAAVIVALMYREAYIKADARAAAVKVQLDNAVDINEKQQKTIETIVEIKNKIDEINNNLGDEFDNINRNIASQNEEMNKIKESSPDAKDFFNIIVPSDVRRLQSNPASNNQN